MQYCSTHNVKDDDNTVDADIGADDDVEKGPADIDMKTCRHADGQTFRHAEIRQLIRQRVKQPHPRKATSGLQWASDGRKAVSALQWAHKITLWGIPARSPGLPMSLFLLEK